MVVFSLVANNVPTHLNSQQAVCVRKDAVSVNMALESRDSTKNDY